MKMNFGKKVLSLLLTLMAVVCTVPVYAEPAAETSEVCIEKSIDDREENLNEYAVLKSEEWFWPGNSKKFKTYDGHRGIDIQDGMNTDVKAAKSGKAYIYNNTCNGKHSTDGNYTPLPVSSGGCTISIRLQKQHGEMCVHTSRRWFCNKLYAFKFNKHFKWAVCVAGNNNCKIGHNRSFDRTASSF